MNTIELESLCMERRLDMATYNLEYLCSILSSESIARIESIIKEELHKIDDTNCGIYKKFSVRRTDGSSDKYRKHAVCEYFVLDWKHDPFTIPAMKAYAAACKSKYPELASDILDYIDNYSDETS